MQVVIMAGGLGRRLRPLTKEIPKPMVPILQKPYLEYQIRYLRQQGFSDILILSGYLSHVIEDYFGDGRGFGVSIHYSVESEPLGTGGGLRLAKDKLENEFIVIYGDSFLPIDMRAFSDDFRAADITGMIVLYDNSSGETSVKNNVRLDPNRLVGKYDKQIPDATLDHVEAGVSAFRKDVLDYFPDHPVVSLEEEVFPRLIVARRMMGWPTSERFYDIGNPERLKTIETFFTQHLEWFA